MENVTTSEEKSNSEQTPARKVMPGSLNSLPASLSAEHIRCAVTVAVVACWAYLTQGGCDPNQMMGFLNSDGGSVKYWPFGGMFLSLHVLQVAARTGKSAFWISDFAKTVVACFSGWILVDFLNGENQRILNDEKYLTLAFVAWYVTNHNIPGTSTNLWETVKGMMPKDHVDVDAILDVASLIWTTQAVCHSVESATSNPSAVIGFSIFTPIMYGLAAGCATEVMRFKELQECSSSMCQTLLVSTYIATDGLSALPIIGDAAGSISGSLEGYVGGSHTNLCLAAVVFARLCGGLLPFDPFAAFTGKLATALNL